MNLMQGLHHDVHARLFKPYAYPISDTEIWLYAKAGYPLPDLVPLLLGKLRFLVLNYDAKHGQLLLGEILARMPFSLIHEYLRVYLWSYNRRCININAIFLISEKCPYP